MKGSTSVDDTIRLHGPQPGFSRFGGAYLFDIMAG